MRANAGAALILLGLSSCLLQETPGSPLGRTRRRVAQSLAGVAAALGLATLLEFAFGWDLGIDLLFVTAPVDIPGVVYPERMAPNAALSSLLLGCSLLILDLETGRRTRPAQYLALAVGFISLFACVGYIYGVTFVSGIEPYTIIAENAAIIFFVLSAGVLFARPDRGLMEVITSDSPGGVAARRLLPLFVGLTVLIGWLVLVGMRLGIYADPSGLSIFSICVIAVFTALVLAVARLLHATDVQRRQAEEALRESEERYRTVADYTYDWEYWLGLDGKFIYVSPSCERITGHSPDAFLDDPALIAEIVHSNDRKSWEDHFRESLHSPETDRLIEFRIVRPDCHERWIGHICQPVYGADGKMLGRRASNRDITERKHAEQRRAVFLERLNSLVELSAEVLAENSAEGMLQKVVDAAREVTDGNISITGHGYVGGTFRIGAVSHSAKTTPCPPGEEFAVENGGVYLDIINGSRTMRYTEGELREHPAWWGLPPGHAPLRGLLGATLVGSDGRPAGLIMVSDKERGDFTEEDETLLGQLASIASLALEHIQARTDVEQRAADLAGLNRELETFSYSVSHDLRAPLRRLDGFSAALLEDYPDKLDERGRDYLGRIRAASRRMEQLIDDLLRLTRLTRHEMRREAVDLSALAQTIATELQGIEPERRVEFVIEPGLVADGDAHLLAVVMDNLLSNAWKFTGKHPRALIEVGATWRDAERLYFVRDDGAGYDPAHADKLFGVFQRLHPADEFSGTGIGLATVQRIVHRHGGRVWAEGEVEKGATFYFTLGT